MPGGLHFMGKRSKCSLMKNYPAFSISPLHSALALIVSGASALLLTHDLSAATATWQGTGSTVAWDTATNWSLGSVPGSGDIAFFGSSGTQTLSLNSAQSIDTLLFSAANSRYTIGTATDVSAGDTLTLKNVTMGSAVTGTQVIVSNVVESGNTTWNIQTGATGVLQVKGSISGAGSLTKTGTGTLIFNGATGHTYSGVTNVNQGTLLLDFANMATPSNIIASSGTLSLGGGTLQVKQQNGVATSQTFAQTNINAGASSVVGTSVGANGVTIALGGLTRTASSGSLSIGSGGGGGVVNFTLPTTGSITTSSVNDATGILGTWASVGNGTSLSYATVSSGAITAYTGATAATAADLSNVTSASTNYSFATGATQTTNITANTLRYTGGAATLANGGNSITLNSLMNAGTGALTISGAGKLIIGASRELVILSNTKDISISSSIQDNATGKSGLTYSGGGRLVLGASNSYTGDTTVLSGTLYIPYVSGASAMGGDLIVGSSGGGPAAVVTSQQDWNLSLTGSSNVTVYSNGSVDLVNNIKGIRNLTIYGGTVNQSYLYISGTVTMQGGTLAQRLPGSPIASGFKNVVTLASSSTAVISANIAAGNTIYNVADGDAAIDLLQSGTKTAGFITKTGAGVMALSAVNTFSGTTTLSNGQLLLMQGAALQNSPLLMNGGTLVFDSSVASHAFQVGQLWGSGNVVLNDNAATPNAVALTIATGTNGTGTYSGALSGDGSIVKTGTGIQIFTGDNTYTGSTRISGGELDINGALVSSPVQVDSGATLGGSGTIGGSADISGAVVGGLTFSNDVTVQKGATAMAAAFNGNIANNGSITSGFTLRSDKVLSGSGSVTGDVNVETRGTINGQNLNVQGTTTFNGLGTLAGSLTSNNVVVASSGTLNVTGTTSSHVTVNSSATLKGTGSTGAVTLVSGTVAGSLTTGAISGSGIVAPGGSPGVLTATSVDLSGGIGFKFELKNATPTYNAGSGDSTNDVLRLTSANPFNGTVATAANIVDIYLGVTSLTMTETFQGGIFADTGSISDILGATYNYFILGDGNGSHSYNGSNYYTLAEFNSEQAATWSITTGTTVVSATFFDGSNVSNGTVLEFSVVPEPSTWSLIAGGVGALVFARNIRRRMIC